VHPLTFLPANLLPRLLQTSFLYSLCAVQYGEEALKEGMGAGGGGGMADIFDLFGGGGRGRSQRERKSDDVRHNLQVSLEELYNGVTK
jgi:DnaJ-class molecular chaperone